MRLSDSSLEYVMMPVLYDIDYSAVGDGLGMLNGNACMFYMYEYYKLRFNHT